MKEINHNSNGALNSNAANENTINNIKTLSLNLSKSPPSDDKIVK